MGVNTSLDSPKVPWHDAHLASQTSMPRSTEPDPGGRPLKSARTSMSQALTSLGVAARPMSAQGLGAGAACALVCDCACAAIGDRPIAAAMMPATIAPRSSFMNMFRISSSAADQFSCTLKTSPLSATFHDWMPLL